MQNLGTLRQLSLGDLADDGREDRGGEIMPSLMATLLHWRTARTNRSATQARCFLFVVSVLCVNDAHYYFLLQYHQ
jgi:hypothetical protein